ncbi:MAG: hypothetical protein JWQ71_2400, partial [Pedosphaera sp.]|nr:hypothetical protein [Pedosphaera sp.]
MRRFFFSMRQFILTLACLGNCFFNATASDLIYVKSPTREATQKASLEATSQKLPSAKLSQWFVLDSATPAFATNGSTELSTKYPIAGKTSAWRENSQLTNAAWQKIEVGSRWLYRTIESDRDEETTLLVGSKRPITIRFNGGSLEGNLGPPGWLADQIANINEVVSFKVALKRGTNYLSIFFSEPTSFYFELSPINDTLRAELEQRLSADFPSEQSYYRLETIPIPTNIVLEVGGLAFMPDKSLMICK